MDKRLLDFGGNRFDATASGVSLLVYGAALNVVIILSAPGSTYYIDFASGDDGNPGTAVSAPWKHCPGDANASNVPLGTSLAAGDKVFFKGGVTYKSSVDIKWSGAPGNPIIYDGNSLGEFGAGKAIMDGEYLDVDTRRYALVANGTHDLVIRHFELTRLGGYSTIDWEPDSLPASSKGIGIDLVNCWDIVVDSCTFNEIGAWANAANMSGNIMWGIGIRVNRSGHNIIISNCEFTKIGLSAVQINSYTVTTNISVQACDIHHYVRWGIDIAAAAPHCTIRDVRIEGNQIRDLMQYAASAWLGLPGTYPHFDGIIMRVGNNPQHPDLQLGTTNQPILISGNRFYNNTTSTANSGTSMIFMTGFGGRIVIANNTFVNTLQSFGGIYVQDIAPDDGTVRADYIFANNTFFGPDSAINLRTLNGEAYAVAGGTVRIKNNVFYKTNADADYSLKVHDGLSNPTELDYNCYYTMRTDGQIGRLAVSGQVASHTLTSLQAEGWELHGLAVNPDFVDSSAGIGHESSMNNLQLRVSSPCIRQGDNLWQLFNTDALNRFRPELGAWTIGAYRAGHSRPQAPTRLRLIEEAD